MIAIIDAILYLKRKIDYTSKSIREALLLNETIFIWDAVTPNHAREWNNDHLHGNTKDFEKLKELRQ